jgi:hypothetical protein
MTKEIYSFRVQGYLDQERSGGIARCEAYHGKMKHILARKSPTESLLVEKVQRNDALL